MNKDNSWKSIFCSCSLFLSPVPASHHFSDLFHFSRSNLDFRTFLPWLLNFQDITALLNGTLPLSLHMRHGAVILYCTFITKKNSTYYRKYKSLEKYNSWFNHLKRLTINIYFLCVYFLFCLTAFYFFYIITQIPLSYSFMLETYIWMLPKKCHSSPSVRSCTSRTMNMATVHSSLHSNELKGKQGRKTPFAARILLSKFCGGKSTVLRGGVLGGKIHKERFLFSN